MTCPNHGRDPCTGQRWLWAALLLQVLLLPGFAYGQSTAGTFLGGVAGVGYGTMGVGSDSDSKTGLVLGAEFGSHRDGYRRWFVDASAQLFKVPSPVLDERYRAVSVMAHRSFGSRIFLAPSLGFELRSWSGPERVETSDVGLAIGASLGTVFRIGESISLVPAVRWQASVIEIEGSVDSRLLSLSLAVLRMSS